VPGDRAMERVRPRVFDLEFVFAAGGALLARAQAWPVESRGYAIKYHPFKALRKWATKVITEIINRVSEVSPTVGETMREKGSPSMFNRRRKERAMSSRT
jgi:hypothetical protein